MSWIGQLPRGWTIAPVKHLALVLNGATPKSGVEELWNGNINWFTPTDLDNNIVTELAESARKLTKLGLDSCAAQLAAPNSVVISSRAPVGSVGVTTVEAATNQGCRTLVPINGYPPKLLANTLIAAREQLQLVSNGTTFLELSTRSLADFKVPVPPKEQWSNLLGFLDRATTRIDTLVAKKTRFIELLREKRQALITHAVTKGLDPNVPMKDSGVEWLGKVPAHWPIPALKHLVATPITDGPHETPAKQDDGVRFISAEAVSNGAIDFSKAWGFISEEDNARFSKKYRPAVNDIYMIKSGATTGVVAIVENDVDFNIWSPLAAIRPNDEVVPRFLLHALRSSEFQAGVALNWSYGTQQNIGMKVLETLPVPTPPVREQHQIVGYLDRATSRIDTLIAKTERSIELLREHRTALITAAVTGKIDLRPAA